MVSEQQPFAVGDREAKQRRRAAGLVRAGDRERPVELDEPGAARVVLHPDPGVSDDVGCGPPGRCGIDRRVDRVRVDGAVVDQAARRMRKGRRTANFNPNRTWHCTIIVDIG